MNPALREIGCRLAASVQRLHGCERYRLRLLDGPADPAQPDAAVAVLLDPRAGFRPLHPLNDVAAVRLQPWLEVLRQGLEPILDLGPGPREEGHP